MNIFDNNDELINLIYDRDKKFDKYWKKKNNQFNNNR